MQHSKVVGGSTAKRVMACPGSVALVNKMPPQLSSKYADEGTLLHNVIADILDKSLPVDSFLGMKYQDIELTQELIDDKLLPALAALDEIDPTKQMEFAVETRVGFGDFLPDVFGSTDLLGRIGTKALVIDWKFGDGVLVTAEENPQLLFYAAAAMRTPEVQWVFKGATEIECVIVQPTKGVSRWVTTPERIKAFEHELAMAVREAQKPDANLSAGDHCRWCAAKPICPKMTGAVDRALKTSLQDLDAAQISAYLKNADVLEGWITDLRALAFQMLEKGIKLPEHKLVAKRAVRRWTDEDAARAALSEHLLEEYIYDRVLISPAKAEKMLKNLGQPLPDCVASTSSGSTLAHVSDARPEVLQIGQQLTAALSKLI
ncbi:MAG: DUF2800 domain-containing protein [Verrucomicrobiaceae bacterium]|nr:MAG: DUF2800 domain-containing protein [Verrucomicrobiaceae bacterium]RPJ32007.1 MAG: DUF2800 domain-containing protein [Verrucomicrobiaceae bacterium]RPJ34192.1 MAG: DUF2800 domain-containing protein [Verrucomicrobiaceae bacterium]RPJ36064.1 MAG: DUF2800 domain-containing protein [Verrucomicrobiaceae bacterium]